MKVTPHVCEPTQCSAGGEKFGKAKGLLQSAARLIREAAKREPYRVSAKRARAWIMPAKVFSKLGVPFGIVVPYARLCGLEKSWHVATEKLIAPPTVLRL